MKITDPAHRFSDIFFVDLDTHSRQLYTITTELFGNYYICSIPVALEFFSLADVETEDESKLKSADQFSDSQSPVEQTLKSGF